MSLSREKFEELGGAVVEEGVSYPSDPDQPLVIVRATLGGHTVERTGRDLDTLLAEIEPLFVREGRLKSEGDRISPVKGD